MKLSIICCITIFAMSFSSCATKKGETRNCPVLDIGYVGSAPNERGNLVGIFSVTNAGGVAVYLPLEGESDDLIHSRYASTEQRSLGGDDWQIFNPLLEEMLAPKAHITVLPGQRKKFRFDANGLFFGDLQVDGVEYSIVLKDTAGCTYRSVPFRP